MSQEVVVAIKLLKKNVVLPQYMTPLAAGLDLAAAIDQDLVIAPGQIIPVPTGVAIALPEGYEAQIRPRSGLALKHGITMINSPGTIDPDYRGEIKVLLINLGSENYVIKPNERIAQMVVAPIARVSWKVVSDLPPTQRADGGFGHTGR